MKTWDPAEEIPYLRWVRLFVRSLIPANMSKVKQGARGVKYLHDEGIIHGDVKGVRALRSFCLPFVDVFAQANFLVDQDLNIRVADFGFSRFVESNTTSIGESRMLGGTLRWMAPELMQDSETRLSPASDVYAFGCTCLEASTDPSLVFLEMSILYITDLLARGSIC